MQRVGTSILGRPRRLSQDRHASARYTLIWEEPPILQAISDPHPVLDLLLRAGDRSTANLALQERLGFDELQANAVMDIQFFRVAGSDQAGCAPFGTNLSSAWRSWKRTTGRGRGPLAAAGITQRSAAG